MQDLNIVLIQTNQHWENKQANFNHLATEHFSKIEKNTCDLLVLPEMFNTGFSMNVEELYEKMDGESIQWLTRWATELNCEIIATLIIKEKNNYFNRLVVVSAKGVINTYDKRHLFRMAGEHRVFTSGEKRVIHTIKNWKILLQTCYDLRFPVFSRNRTIDDKKEYDVVLYTANWPEKRANAWKILLQARAIENQVYCIGLNRVGIDGNENSYSGDSMVVDPWGEIEFLATKQVQQVKFLTLSIEKLNRIEQQFPAFKDADKI